MRFEQRRTSDGVARRAADMLCDAVGRGAWRIGVATGATPLPTYVELVRRQRDGLVDLRHCHLILLDEYVGLTPHDPNTYRATIEHHVAVPLGISAGRIHGPRLDADPRTSADDWARCVDDLGGVDVQVLGIGRNGHIGFNEPGTALDSRTRVIALTPETRRDNARYFARPDDVPTHAITRGLADIHEAREILLLATGPAKRPIITRLVRHDPDIPASILQSHPAVTVLVDREASATGPNEFGHSDRSPEPSPAT